MRYFPAFEKKPLISEWQKEARKAEDIPDAWSEAYPQCDWGLVTGESEGFFVLDADKKTNGLETLLTLELPETHTVRTQSDGRHLYFKWPKDRVIRNKQGFLPGLDIRGTGGYVMAPPSQGYQVISDLPLAEAPESLLALIESRPKEAQEWTEPVGVKGKLNSRTLAFVAFGAGPGLWHQEFFQAAMNMKQEGYTQDEAEQLLSKATGHLDTTDEVQLEDVYSNRTPEFQSSASPVLWAENMWGSVARLLADPSRSVGLSTGIEGLDAMLGGGKRTGELTVLMAEAKTGKNTLWHKLMHTLLQKGIPVGYASQELSPELEVLPNLAKLELKQDIDEHPEALAGFAPAWKLAFTPEQGPFPQDDLMPWLEACASAGIRYFFIDHYHFLLSDPEDYKEGSRFIRHLKRFAREKDIHIDLIVQPKVIGYGESLSLNSGRGGAAIGQALDNLLLMERVKDEHGSKTHVVKVRLEVARHRLARPGHIYLKYDPNTMDFEEVVAEYSSIIGEPTLLSVTGKILS